MDDREMMHEILELTKDNHKRIKKMYHAQVWSSIWSTLYYIIIIAVGVGAFYYIQPYIDTFTNAYKSLRGTTENASSTSININLDTIRRLVK